MKELYLVCITSVKVPVVHSVHADEKRAREWKSCLEHDGGDCEVIKMPAELAQDIFDLAAMESRSSDPAK